MIKVVNVVFIFIFIFSNANAKIIKPSNNIKQFEVVEIQLNGYTGPLERFKKMIKGNSYSMLLDHVEHKITEKFISNDVATYEVIVLDFEKKYFKFKWQVEKYNKDGPLKDCWLTTVVSQPVPYGSAI